MSRSQRPIASEYCTKTTPSKNAEINAPIPSKRNTPLRIQFELILQKIYVHWFYD